MANQSKRLPFFFKSNTLSLTTLGLVILIFYLNTLFNGFVHDDYWQIVTNQTIQSVNNLGKIFTTCIAEDLLGGCHNRGFYYRPLQFISYLITYQFFPQAGIFHFFNLIYFFVCSALVYFLFNQLLKRRSWAFLGALIFATHPINSEVVNWISAVPELLLLIFIISSLICYIFFLKNKLVYDLSDLKQVFTFGNKKIIFLFSSIIFFFLALLSKETAIFFLILLPILEVLLSKNLTIRSAFAAVKKRARYFSFFILPIVVYLLIRTYVLGRVVYRYEGYYDMDLKTQIITAVDLYLNYIVKLFWPYPLSFQGVYLPVSIVSLQTLISILVIFINIYLLRWFFKRDMRASMFGVALLNVGILPALIFVNKLGENLFSERYLFLSSVGFCLIIVENLKAIWEKRKMYRYKSIFYGILAIYLLFSWWTIFNRNKDWKDNFTSYQSMVRINPQNVRAYLGLAQIYKSKQELESAKNEYSRVLEIDPNHIEAKKGLQFVLNRYTSKKTGLEFNYPSGWTVQEGQDKINITSADNKLLIEIVVDQRGGISIDDYLAKQNASHGTLVNQGLAQIPKFDLSVVKIWNDENAQKLQFFLFKRSKVVHLLVSPELATSMGEFDNILATMEVK